MALAKPNNDTQRISDKISAIEKEVDKFKKLAQVSVIVSMIAGGGGLFSIVTYFLNYNRSVHSTNLDIHSKEMAELRSTIDFLYQHGDTPKAKEYTNQLIALHASYYDTSAISKPVSNNISQPANAVSTVSEKDSVLKTLGNISSEQYIAKKSGDKLFYTKSTSLNTSRAFEITYDYLRYRTVNGQIQNDSTKKYSYKYGIGTRIKCDIIVLDKNISQSNLLSLQSIASLAELGKLQATISFQVLGITRNDMLSKLPLPTNVNVATVTTFTKAMKDIMELVTDKSTQIHPMILSIYSPPNLADEEVLQDILSKKL